MPKRRQPFEPDALQSLVFDRDERGELEKRETALRAEGAYDIKVSCRGDNLFLEYRMPGVKRKPKRRCTMKGVEEYGMSHRPAEADSGAPLHDLTANGVYPADVYTRPRWYDTGDADYMEAWSVAARYRGKPNARVWVYRSLPCGKRTINRGDWVSTVRRYARDEGRHATDPSKDSCVIAARVPASCIHTDGNSLFEFGYNCDDKQAITSFRPRKRRKS